MSTAYLGSGLEDDIHLLDYVSLSTNTDASNSAEDLTVNGASGSGPSCPDNYTMVMDFVIISNTASSAGVITIQVTNGTTTIVLANLQFAANTTLVLDTTKFKFIAYSGYKFQCITDGTAKGSVQALVRLVPGCGY